MHMQGTPQDMQKNPEYEDVMVEVSDFLKNVFPSVRLWGWKEKILF